MGQRKSRIKSRAKGLAPKKLSVRQQDAVKGGWSWGVSNPGTQAVLSRAVVRQDVPAVP
jgi:hypothetical protein